MLGMLVAVLVPWEVVFEGWGFGACGVGSLGGVGWGDGGVVIFWGGVLELW